MPVRHLLAALAMAVIAGPALAGEQLDRIVREGVINIGVRTDTPPFAYVKDGLPTGFTTDLCGRAAAAILITSPLEKLDARVITVTAENRFDKLRAGEIDVLCGATTITLERRKTMSFTLPTFATGIGGVMAADAPALLQEVLITGGQSTLSPSILREALGGRRLGAHAGTTAETWLRGEVLPDSDGITVTTVSDHRAGLEAVAAGEIDVYFVDRAILGGLLRDDPNPARFAASRATYTFEPYGLAIPRDDEDLRLVLDRALSYLYRSGAIFDLYRRYFGEPGPNERMFYSVNALPE